MVANPKSDLLVSALVVQELEVTPIKHDPEDFSVTLAAVLRRELENRCKQNPRFSLRRFAQILEIDPTNLSKIIRGKQIPGDRLTRRLIQILGISAPQFSKNHYREQLGAIEPILDSDYRKISEEEFVHLSNWYSFAILELLELEDFEDDENWMASRLGISVHQVRASLQRMVALGWIRRRPGGWIDLSQGKSTVLGPNPTSAAGREHQKQILGQALTALDEISVEYRSQTSMTLAIAIEDLAEAKKMLKEFRRFFARKMSSRRKKQEVYQLSLSFFPATKLTPTTRKALK